VSYAAELAEKLERQPVRGGNVSLSWHTIEEIIDELRKLARIELAM